MSKFIKMNFTIKEAQAILNMLYWRNVDVHEDYPMAQRLYTRFKKEISEKESKNNSKNKILDSVMDL